VVAATSATKPEVMPPDKLHQEISVALGTFGQLGGYSSRLGVPTTFEYGYGDGKVLMNY
jgi:hypothetical protein